MGLIERLSKVPDAPLYDRARLRLERTGGGPARPFIDIILSSGLADEAQETVMVAALDGALQVRTLVEIGRGEYHRVTVPLPAMLAVPLLAGCSHVAVAHNHPSGNLVPSLHDFDMTAAAVRALNYNGLTLDDHVIVVPGGKYSSMKTLGVLPTPEPIETEVEA